MKTKLAILSILLFPIVLFPDDRKHEFPQGWYFSLLTAKHTGVPTSYARGSFNDDNGDPIYNSNPKTITSSSIGPAFAIGGTLLFLDYNLIGEIEFEYSYAKFSDWRITNRKYNYYLFGFKLGYLLPIGFPLALYGAFGVGGLVQSDFMEFDFYDPFNYLYLYEVTPKSEYPEYFSIGLKLGVMRHCCIRGEWRHVFYGGEGTYAGDSGGTSYYYTTGVKPSNLGNRISFGVDFYFRLYRGE